MLLHCSWLRDVNMTPKFPLLQEAIPVRPPRTRMGKKRGAKESVRRKKKASPPPDDVEEEWSATGEASELEVEVETGGSTRGRRQTEIQDKFLLKRRCPDCGTLLHPGQQSKSHFTGRRHAVSETAWRDTWSYVFRELPICAAYHLRHPDADAAMPGTDGTSRTYVARCRQRLASPLLYLNHLDFLTAYVRHLGGTSVPDVVGDPKPDRDVDVDVGVRDVREEVGEEGDAGEGDAGAAQPIWEGLVRANRPGLAATPALALEAVRRFARDNPTLDACEPAVYQCCPLCDKAWATHTAAGNEMGLRQHLRLHHRGTTAYSRDQCIQLHFLFPHPDQQQPSEEPSRDGAGDDAGEISIAVTADALEDYIGARFDAARRQGLHPADALPGMTSYGHWKNLRSILPRSTTSRAATAREETSETTYAKGETITEVAVVASDAEETQVSLRGGRRRKRHRILEEEENVELVELQLTVGPAPKRRQTDLGAEMMDPSPAHHCSPSPLANTGVNHRVLVRGDSCFNSDASVHEMMKQASPASHSPQVTTETPSALLDVQALVNEKLAAATAAFRSAMV